MLRTRHARVIGWSRILLMVIIAVFVAQVIARGLTEALWLEPKNLGAKPWGLVTSVFLHASPLHLFFNCFALLMFGPFLEARIGSKNFLALFFAAGVGGNLLYCTSFLAGIDAGCLLLARAEAFTGSWARSRF